MLLLAGIKADRDRMKILSLAEPQSSQRKMINAVGRIREGIIMPTLSAPDGAKIIQK